MHFSYVKASKLYELVVESQEIGFPYDFFDDLIDNSHSSQELADGFVYGKYSEYYFDCLSNIMGGINYHHKDIHVYKSVYFSETIVRRCAVFEIPDKKVYLLKLKNPSLYRSLIETGVLANPFTYDDKQQDISNVHTQNGAVP